jgi:phosphate butyryltransferase
MERGCNMACPRNFTEVIDILKRSSTHQKVALAAAADDAALTALVEASEKGLVDYLLFGNKARILEIAKKDKLKIDPKTIEDIDDEHLACTAAVQAVAGGKADVLMKGSVHTDIYLHAVLDKETGLRGNGFISHVMIWECLHWGKLIFVSDAVVNICPDLGQKVTIIENAVRAAHVFGIEEPKVAIVCAVENVNPKMPPTIDAAAITMMAKRKQIKLKCLIDGPLALDNAISEEAARTKGIDSPVAGKADILIAPDIEAGNILAKAYPFLVPGGEMAGVLVGARKPVILTSRADSAKSKLYSIAAAAYLSKG